MRVYAIITQGTKIIITKKAELNPHWGEDTKQVVGQAGQYALPGGKRNLDETDLKAAKRETLEETGYEIPNSGIVTVSGNLGGYKTVTFVLPATENIQNVHQTMRNNVTDNPNAVIQPVNQEHQDVLLIDKNQATNYLGVQQAVSQQNQTLTAQKAQQKPTSQAIDWFKNIAANL